MKRSIAAVLLVAFALLTGCGAARSANAAPAAPAAPASVAAEVASGNAEEASGNALEAPGGAASDGVTGVWQEKDYEERWQSGEYVYEAIFTHDGLMYVDRSAFILDLGMDKDEIEFEYEIKGGKLLWTTAFNQENYSFQLKDVGVRNDTVTLTVTEDGKVRRVELIKTPIEAPESLTRAGKEQTAAAQSEYQRKWQATKEEILAFAQRLGEGMGVEIRENNEDQFEFSVYRGVRFSSEDVNFHILKEEDVDGDSNYGYYYEASMGGSWVFSAEAYVLDGYAIVFDYQNYGVPEEWQWFLDLLTEQQEERLVGVWRQEDHEEMTLAMERAYELSFTDEGRLYIRVYAPSADAGYAADTLECDYSFEKGLLAINTIDQNGQIEELIPLVRLYLNGDRISFITAADGETKVVEVIKTPDVPEMLN